MKTLATIVLMSVALAVAAQAQTVNFDNAAAGTAPTGWTATKTGSGDAKWTVEKDDTAPSKPKVTVVPAQLSLTLSRLLVQT